MPAPTLNIDVRGVAALESERSAVAVISRRRDERDTPAAVVERGNRRARQ